MPATTTDENSAQDGANSQQRMVQIEVELITIRRFTKVITLPEQIANPLIGQLWANDSRGGLSESDCISACMETPGNVTSESIETECDTIEVLEITEPIA
jgi:hypothetical protein